MNARDTKHEARLLAMAMMLLGSSVALAMPTQQELKKAQPLVAELMAPIMDDFKAKKKTAAEVADAAVKYAGEAETEAAKFMLYRSSIPYYVRGEAYDKAADAVEQMKANVKDVPAEVVAEIISKATVRANKEKAPRLFELYQQAKTQATAEKDVKELRREYCRRTYREAAPWIDRFRGVIRKNWYGNFPSTQHLNEFRETFCMINALGLDAELRGYLAEAQKAVRNPHSKALLEKLVADYDAGMKALDCNPSCPSAKMVEKVTRPKPVPTAADSDFTNRIARALAFSKVGNWPGAKEEFLAAAANGLVDPKLRTDSLVRTLGTLVGDTLKIDAKGAIALWNEVAKDDFKKAYGISLAMNGNWGAPRVISSLAQAFMRRRQPEEAAKVYDAWIAWDGNKLPSGLRAKRVFAKVDFFRSQKNVDVKPYMNAYLQAARDCAKNGANAQERGDAKLRLWREEMAAKSVDERLKGLFELIDDRFMLHALRASATKAIPDACTVDGKTDWARVSSEAVKALAAGDWSGLWRNTYTRQNRSDTRLDVLLEIAAKMEKAEAKQIAADFIVKGATAIGYTKDATKQSLDLGGPDGFDARVKKLDAAMAKLGVARK